MTDLEYIEEQNIVLKMQDKAIDARNEEISRLKKQLANARASEKLAWDELKTVSEKYENLKLKIKINYTDTSLKRISQRINEVEVDMSNTKTKVHNIVQRNNELTSGITSAIRKLTI